MAKLTSEKVSPHHLLNWWELMYSLRLYYRTSPGAALNRCPTNIFLNAIRQAFEGTGEIEDGTIELEDLIVIIASCIDHVRSLICTLKGLADVQGLKSVLFAKSAGDETESRWDGRFSEGFDGDAEKDRCEPVIGRSCLVDQHLTDIFTYSGIVHRCYSMHTCTAGRISSRENALNQAIG
jgi:hypothetical protein